MKLKETISSISTEGIFKSIKNLNVFSWLSTDMAKNLDLDYYFGHSGEKSITPLYRNILADTSILTPLNVLANIIVTKYKENWDRLYLAIIDSEYNPIHNYNVHTLETPDIENNSKEEINTDVTTSSNGSTDTYGFNSVEPVPASKNDNSQRVTGSKDNNTREKTDKQTGTITTDKSGNIGVTSTQKLINEEIMLRRNNNFVKQLFSDVDSVLCLRIY